LAKKPSLALSIALIAFAGIVYLFAWSSIFSVSSVEITGAPTSESKAKISELAAISVGQKLARVEPRAISHRIESIEWVLSSNVSRNWINGHVGITVTPRIPVAIFQTETIDSNGKIFVLPGFNGSSLPVVDARTPSLGLRAIALFNSLPASFRATVTSLSAVNDLNFQLNCDYKGRALKVLWGKDEKSALKIEVLRALMQRPENSSITRIDLSAPHAPIVK
jgi:cell division septal protein FtsQ